MVERKVIHKGNIGNALHSVAPDHITTTADEIFDEERQEYQQDINEGVGRYIENPEFIRVEIDSDKRIIRAIKADGTEYLGAGVEVHGNINTDGAVTTILDNPEFSKVYLDNDGRILYGIQRDGNFYFGAGVPRQIIDYIEARIADLSLDEYEAIVSFLDGLEFDEDFKTLRELLNEKVDKEEGKSLIDAEYANSVRYIENPEFAEVKVDNEDKILEAILKDGTKLLPAGVKVIGTTEYDCATIKTLENPEFAGVWLDGDDKILFGVEKDGNFLFGCGVPKQVKEYIEQKIEELSLDEYESIVTFIGDYINNTTLEELLSKKVDGEYVENPEFIEAKIDAEDKVLEGIQQDGTKVIGGDLNVGGSASINGNAKILGSMEISGVSYKIVENPEYLAAWVDADNKIIFGFKADGKTFVGDADFFNAIKNNAEAIEEINSVLTDIIGVDNIDWNALTSITAIENPEFISVEIDTEGKVLSGRRIDGTKFENMPIEISNMRIEGITDLEDRIEVKTDSERRIISYRDKDGVLHENIGIETPNVNTQEVNASSINSTTVSTETIDANEINLPASGLTELGQALKDNGFYAIGMSDFSNTKNVELPEPKHYGIINLIISSLPIEDEDVSKGYVEYYDFSGNYFKKKCKIEPQGQSSKNFARTGGKGNYTLKIDDAIKSKVKFGSWVPQKSWHLKGCAKDVTRGYLSTSYKWAYMMMQALDASPIRNLTDDASITTTQATGDRLTDWPTDARCLPDGFPVEIYINGEYWGLYALQLQKKSENYAMDNDDYESLIIDAELLMTENSQGISVGGFWSGDIWWNRFEVRNPEPLICMDGTEYDGDNPKELIDDTSDFWNPDNQDMVNTAVTKGIIKSFSTKYLAVQALIDAENYEDAKSLFAQYFDVNACMLVYIFNCLTSNFDSVNKNTLWATWNNGKIVPLLWDLDSIYGESWIGVKAQVPNASMWTYKYARSEWPLGQLWTLYETELKAAYASLRSNGIISVETWHDVMVKNWIERIGKEAYDRDIKKWKETPSYRKNYTNTAYWSEGNSTTSPGVIQEWNNQTAYSIGDKVTLRQYDSINSWMIYTAVAASDANNPQCPVTKFYTGFPKVGGYYNSYKRIEKWLEEQISLSDSVMGYNS